MEEEKAQTGGSVVRIFNESEEGGTTWSVEDVKEYVKQFMTYEYQIKDLQASRREWSADYLKKKSLPKKEVASAIRSAKADLDMGAVNIIYDNICELVSE